LREADPTVQILGSLPQYQLKEWMSRSHVMVLPSIEEGLAYVQAQAMACGCPVIASNNTGAEDLFTDGQEGFIVPIRDASALGERLELLAADPARRNAMSVAGLVRVQKLGGWQDYAGRLLAVLSALLESRSHEAKR
jgi:glycosyltransferase involved in cell wall biosynthesis